MGRASNTDFCYLAKSNGGATIGLGKVTIVLSRMAYRAYTFAFLFLGGFGDIPIGFLFEGSSRSVLGMVERASDFSGL